MLSVVAFVSQRLTKPFPMLRRMKHRLPADYEGPVFVWDVDKTYLDTHFSSTGGIIEAALQSADDKWAVPGAVPVLRALQRPRYRGHQPGLFFVTASPPQIRRKLERKLVLDEIDFDGVTYKDQFKLAGRLHFDQIRVQAAYKFTALLLMFRELPSGCQLNLFGDDVEQDCTIFCLFADAVAGRIDALDVVRALTRLGVRKKYAVNAANLVHDVPRRDAVNRVFIHLYRDPAGGTLHDFEEHVVGYAQGSALAIALQQEQLISSDDLEDILTRTPTVQPIVGPSSQRTTWSPTHLID